MEKELADNRILQLKKLKRKERFVFLEVEVGAVKDYEERRVDYHAKIMCEEGKIILAMKRTNNVMKYLAIGR